MDEDLSRTTLPLGKNVMNFFQTEKSSITSKVKVNTVPKKTIQLEDGKPYALWVGKKNSEFDSLFILPESLIKCEVKTVENVTKMIALTGKSKDSFESEKKKSTSRRIQHNKQEELLFIRYKCESHSQKSR